MKKTVILLLVTYLLPLLLRAYFATLKIIEIDRWQNRPFSDQQNVIYVLWHENMLLPLYVNRQCGVWILVSQHFDGELIARVLHHFGFRTIRGSSTRGGLKALVEMRRRLSKEGGDVAITPDGPRGPRRSAKAGAIHLAATTGRPLIPVGIAYEKAWRFNSWDRFCLIKPLSSCAVAYGEEIFIPEKPDSETVNSYLEMITQKLNQLDHVAAEAMELK